MDISTVLTAFGVLKQALTGLRVVSKEIQDSRVSAFTLEIQDALFDLREKIDALAKENEELREQLIFKAGLTRKDELYWSEGDDSPFCPKCWEERTKAIHLISSFKPRMNAASKPLWKCPSCNFSYKR